MPARKIRNLVIFDGMLTCQKTLSIDKTAMHLREAKFKCVLKWERSAKEPDSVFQYVHCDFGQDSDEVI